MPSKQELMEIMENRLPGATLPINNTPVEMPPQPPAYPDLATNSFASPHHSEQQQQPLQPEQQQPFQAAEPATIYTIRQPAISLPAAQFGTRSHLAYCPSCHATQMTRCEYESGMMTHIIAAILFFTTCCCCLPYFIDNCKSARHYCQNCGSYLGAHTK